MQLIKPDPAPGENVGPSAPETASWQQQYQQYRQSYGPQYQQYQSFDNDQAPAEGKGPSDSGRAAGIVSLIFGILGFTCLFFPPFSITGLITGIIGMRKSKTVPAGIGLILSVISLVFFLTALIITAINGFDFSALRLNELANLFK